MRAIKLMPDYQCFPLWEASPGDVGNINPENLPISLDLKAELAAWTKIYDATLDVDDPACSGFQSEEAEAEFKRVGNDLAERLKCELGPDFAVIIKI